MTLGALGLVLCAHYPTPDPYNPLCSYPLNLPPWKVDRVLAPWGLWANGMSGKVPRGVRNQREHVVDGVSEPMVSEGEERNGPVGEDWTECKRRTGRRNPWGSEPGRASVSE